MTDQNDPKILVKKADGSYVHVPLSELRKKNERPAAAQVVAPPANLPVAEVVPQKKAMAPTVQKSVQVENERLEKELPMVPKQVAKSVPPPQAKPVVKVVPSKLPEQIRHPENKVEVKHNKEDFGSLLDERLPGTNKIMSLTSSSREKQVDSIVGNLNFKISGGNSSRLRTIVQLFLKEVRGEADTIEILRRPEIEGGMGLSVEQAKEVIDKCQNTALPTDSVDKIPVLKNRPTASVVVSKQSEPKKISVVGVSVQENDRLEAELPTVLRKDYQGKSFSKAPEPIVQPKPAVPPKPSRQALEDQITKITLSEAPVDVFKLSKERTQTSMRDVKANPVEIGPVEEIRYFNLADFRRLSTDPVEAANRLKQKFINLRDESILLYFEAWEAWKISPLHHDYLKTVSESLLKRIPLVRVASDKTKIQVQEINALVRMEKQLG